MHHRTTVLSYLITQEHNADELPHSPSKSTLQGGRSDEGLAASNWLLQLPISQAVRIEPSANEWQDLAFHYKWVCRAPRR
jgi:hypothetical protein